MVGIGRVGGEHLRLPGKSFFSSAESVIPLFQDVIRPRRELRIRGNDSQPFLVGEDLIAQVVPAHVELAFELVDPLLRRLVRRVGSARNVVEEERLVGRPGVELLHVLIASSAMSVVRL